MAINRQFTKELKKQKANRFRTANKVAKLNMKTEEILK